MVIQVLLSFFLLFAISRVVMQVRNARLSIGGFLFWSALFIFALVGVLDPHVTTYVARVLGIGRGSDVVLYVSIALLFYLIFRLSISIEEIRRDITNIVRKIAMENLQQSKKNAYSRQKRNR
jgi:hypothetical protein